MGWRLPAALRSGFPKIKVLLITVQTSYIEEALAAGADVCLLNDCVREEFSRATREVG